MKNSKKGISLIVLVITIIVIIILSAAVLLTMSKNNPVDNAVLATYSSDKAEIKSAISLFITNYMAKHEGNSPLTGTSAITIDGTVAQLESALPSITLTWGDLGFDKKPASIATATYNPETGVFSCTPSNSKIKASDY